MDSLHHVAASGISIHTPLAGSDFYPTYEHYKFIEISIHTPLAGSDRTNAAYAAKPFNFNPHSPRGE